MITDSLDESLHIVEHSFPDLSEAVCSAWKELADSVDANFSLYPGWTKITAESLGIFDDSKLITVEQEQKLIAAIPFVRSNLRSFGINLRALELVSNKVSYHNGFVSSLAPDAVLDILISVASQQRVDVIHLAGIPDTSTLGRYLKKQAADTRYFIHEILAETSPFMPLNMKWEELLASKPKKFRYKVRKRADFLESSGSLRMKLFHKPDDCDFLLNAMKIVEGHSWKNKAGISIFQRDHESKYYKFLLPFLASRKALFANVLFHEEKPIAYNLCCIWNGWVGQQKTSFDTEYSEMSPGSIVIDHAIRHAIDLEAKEFDFLGDADRHKLAWSKLARPHTDYFLYLKSRPKGRFVGALKEVRRRLKKKH